MVNHRFHRNGPAQGGEAGELAFGEKYSQRWTGAIAGLSSRYLPFGGLYSVTVTAATVRFS